VNISDEDRAYFDRIARYERELARERLAQHLALTLAERLERSLALSRLHGSRALERANDDPSPFYERARSLGLYTG
jgi:hypothetical protein